MTKEIPWLRVLTEGVVIVLSILLAFSIDAWWDGRQERDREYAALDALARDFDNAAVILDRHAAVLESTAAAAKILLGWTGPNARPRPADSLATLMVPMWRLTRFEPPMGTLDALLGSGDFRLVRSDQLRGALAAFRAQLASMNRTQDYGRDVAFGLWAPYMLRALPQRNFGARGDGASEFEADLVGQLRSMEFENVVNIRLINTEFALVKADAMGALIARIQGMLRAELMP